MIVPYPGPCPLHMPALQGLDDQLIDAAANASLVPRWHGRGLMAADA